MAELGQEDKPKLITEQMPLPETVDGIVGAVRTILGKKSIRSIHIETDKPIVYQRVGDTAEIQIGADPDLSDLSPYEIARRSQMQEFDFLAQGLEKESPIAIFGWMMMYIERHHLVPTHLLVAETTDFWKWLGILPKRVKGAGTFLGLKIEKDAQMPSQAFLIFGAEDRWAAPHEAKMVVKGTC